MCLLSTKYGIEMVQLTPEKNIFCGENVLSDREVHRGETLIPGTLL